MKQLKHIIGIALGAALPSAAHAIPSPDLIINLSASVAQLAGLLSVVLGGIVFSRRRVAVGDAGAQKAASPMLKWCFRLCLALLAVSLVGNALQHAQRVDDRNQRLQTNLVRPSTENGKRVGDVSLKTLSFSDQQTHPLGLQTSELDAWRREGRAVQIIDVREDEEVETGRIEGALHVRYPDLRQDPSPLDAAGETVLLCYSGNRSSELCDTFAKQGKSCRFVVGGYEKWIAEGRALERDGAPTRAELREIPDFPNKATLLDTPEAVRLVSELGATIVDVRYPMEFESGHLPGAVNLPLRRMTSAEVDAALASLPRDKPVLSACYDRRTCFYSQIAGLKLSRLGLDYRGRYTTPHEFYLPRRQKAHIAEWERMREGETLLAKVSQPLHDALDWLRSHTGHYASALVLLVLALRLAMLPLAWKADRDQRVQRSLAPQVAALKEKFSRDPGRASRAMLSLYRKHGIRTLFNSLGSMLQLMLFLVFFSVVDGAAGGWSEPLLWIDAPGRPDPMYVLPSLFGVLFAAFLAITVGRRGRAWLALYVAAGAAMTALACALDAAVNIYLTCGLLLLLAQHGMFALLWRRGVGNGRDAVRRPLTAGIVPLADADRHPAAGQKAARLAKMMRAGFRVPDGFVITHDTVVKGRDPKTGKWRFSRTERSAFKRLWRRLKAKAVAVRSSGVNEDGVVNSYAGVFESVLNVTRDDFESALEQVSASLSSEISSAYGASESEQGGVLVQAMVDAEYAGVLFTEHPASAGCAMVELVEGLGEALVAGRVTPKCYRFGRFSGQRLDREKPPVDLAPLLDLGRRLEELFGGPQDVEWAYAGGRFVLLQSRDITSRADARGGTDGTDERERARVLTLVKDAPDHGAPVLVQNELSELLANPTPVSASLMERLWSAHGSTDIACRMLGIPYDVDEDSPPYVVTVFGALYVNRGEEQRRLRRGPGAAAAFRLARAAEAIEADFREGFLPGFLRKLRMHEALDLGRLSDDELATLFERWSNEFVTETYVHAEVINLATDFYWKTARQKLEAGGHDAVSLLAHESDTVVTRAMTLLGASARGSGQVRQFLDLFGHRAPEDYELSQPRYSESPELVIRQAARARRMGTRMNPGVELPADAVLRLTVDRARRFQVLKEEAKHHCLRQLAQLRRVLVELDGRFGLDGGIFQLHVDEVPGLARAGEAERLKECIATRREAEKHWRQVRLPAELSVKDLEALEPLNGARLARPSSGDLAGTRVSGTGGVEGRVHVLRDAADVRHLRDGEIVVARLTDPSWYPLFPRAGGIVTEIGGWLSHAAIVAREFNLTAIVGVSDACDRLRTGDLVRLGADGRIERLAQAKEPALAAVPAPAPRRIAAGD